MASGTVRLFVYGTLLRGEPNHHLLAGARFVAEAATGPGYELVDLGAYPALLEGGGASVWGEVYEVDAETLARVDALEDHPGYYRRVTRRLAGIAENIGEVELYLLLRHQAAGHPRIASGRWRDRSG